MSDDLKVQNSHDDKDPPLDDWKDLKTKTKTVIKWMTSTLLDNLFLLAWLLLQVGVSQAISVANISGIDQWLLIIFQIIFAI